MKSKWLARVSKVFVLGVLGFVFLRVSVLTNVEAGNVGVRYNNAVGLLEEDLGLGWHWEVVGLQRVWRLPSRYLFLNYTADQKLVIRTKDNNTVELDVSVPYRIIPGHAHKVMDAGNHLPEGDNRFRFERLANDTTISVLREHLAQLRSQDFYDTDRRLAIAAETTQALNEQLKGLQLEAERVLIRATYFRPDYEQQLASIQLNEQQKLLDGAKQEVATVRQKLDNYTQQTNALVSAKQQDWERRIAEIDRAYQVGLIDSEDDRSPGVVRRLLEALGEEAKVEYVKRAVTVFGIEEQYVTDEHLLGIENIEAETSEYESRTNAEANGVSGRLSAEGEALVAKVNGAYELKLNALLGSPGGRAYTAYRAAKHIKFDKDLTFNSSEGVPSVLRLREFAERFMGKR